MKETQLVAACISDLHGALPKINKCDIVLIAGDIVAYEYQRNNELSNEWFLSEFKDWVNDLQCDKVYFIGGNHDFYLQRLGKDAVFKLILEMEKRGLTKNKLIYVQDELIKLDNGKTLYGCPWCTGPAGWAFSPASQGINNLTEIYAKYEEIPDCDILLCHQPPLVGKLGCSYPDKPYEKNYGSDTLRQVIYDRKIGAVICGHIHSGIHNGIEYPTPGCDTMFYNVSIVDEDSRLYYLPTYLVF